MDTPQEPVGESLEPDHLADPEEAVESVGHGPRSVPALVRRVAHGSGILLVLVVLGGMAWYRGTYVRSDGIVLFPSETTALDLPPETSTPAPAAERTDLAGTTPDAGDGPETQRGEESLASDAGTAEENGAVEAGGTPTAADASDERETSAPRDWANSEIDRPIPGAYVAVFLGRESMGLVLGQEYIRVYRTVAFPEQAGRKAAREDARAPLGNYRVMEHRLDGNEMTLVLNYPSEMDARRAIHEGRIDRPTYDRIASAETAGILPPFDTPLGGPVVVRGRQAPLVGSGSDLVIPVAAMQELWVALQKGAEVKIRQ